MRRKPDDDDAGAMDSLLDTMTNVVGILVIVLVVTQLGVGDAVQRISESIKVDPEQLKENQAKIADLDQQKTLLDAQLGLLDPNVEQNDDFLDEELEALKKRLEDEDLKLANLNKKNLAQQQALVLGEKEEEELAKERKKLEDEIAASLAEVAKVKATLEQTPDREILPPKEMRLPDPRPAPEGTKPFQLICYKNKIFPFKFYPVQMAARERSAELLRKKKFLIDPKEGIDGERFVKEFNKKPFRNEFFDFEMRNHPDGEPRIACIPRERAGAEVKDVERRNSQFSKDIRATDPSEYYLQFLVCGDSYDVYLSARALAEESQLAVGWSPQPANWIFAGKMGGDVRFGKSKPAPPKPANPNPAPKKPNNVID